MGNDVEANAKNTQTYAHMIKKTLLMLLATASITCLQAGTAAIGSSGKNTDSSVQAADKSIYDKIWGLATLYKDDSNPILEEFDFTGRVQIDYFNVDSSKGNNDYFEIRRLRLGVDSWWADRHVQIKATVDTTLRSYNKDSIFYNRMTDLFINFHVNDAINIRVGKFEPHFGYDREFSDNQQKFFERSFFDDNVFNNTGNDYISGVSVLGKVGDFGYQVAAFSDQADREFGRFEGGASYLAEINYDFKKSLGAEKALWALDFMHMENNTKSNVFNTMENAAATYFDYQKGRLGFVTQLGYGNGISNKGDIYSLMIMPTFYLIENKLELVTRYQLGLAEKSDGITTINRQESTVGKFTGDTLNSGYVGLNYYLYGQKLKLMLGEQYDDLTGGKAKTAGYSGWTTLVGMRMFW